MKVEVQKQKLILLGIRAIPSLQAWNYFGKMESGNKRIFIIGIKHNGAVKNTPIIISMEKYDL
jgi:hypothetical protein